MEEKSTIEKDAKLHKRMKIENLNININKRKSRHYYRHRKSIQKNYKTISKKSRKITKNEHLQTIRKRKLIYIKEKMKKKLH